MSMLLAIPAGACGLLACKTTNIIAGDAFDKVQIETGCKATAFKVAGVALLALSFALLVLSIAAITFPIAYGSILGLNHLFSPTVSQFIATLAICIPLRLATPALAEWLNMESFNRVECC